MESNGILSLSDMQRLSFANRLSRSRSGRIIQALRLQMAVGETNPCCTQGRFAWLASIFFLAAFPLLGGSTGGTGCAYTGLLWIHHRCRLGRCCCIASTGAWDVGTPVMERKSIWCRFNKGAIP